jgi:hypothetical protein
MSDQKNQSSTENKLPVNNVVDNVVPVPAPVSAPVVAPVSAPAVAPTSDPAPGKKDSKKADSKKDNKQSPVAGPRNDPPPCIPPQQTDCEAFSAAFDKVSCDFYKLLNLILKKPKDECYEKLFHATAKCDPNLKENLCKLAVTLTDFSCVYQGEPFDACVAENPVKSLRFGCKNNEYIFYYLNILYGRFLDCHEKPCKTPLCVIEQKLNYKALGAIATLLSANQQNPETNVTLSTMFEILYLFLRSMDPCTSLSTMNMLTIVLLAAIGCKTDASFYNNADPEIPPCPDYFVFNMPVDPSDVSTLLSGTISNFFTVDIISRFKVFLLIFMIVFKYLCDPSLVSISHILASTITIGDGYILDATGAIIIPFPPQEGYVPTPVGTDVAINLSALCLIKLLRRLYCTFAECITSKPSPEKLFEFLVKYNRVFNNKVRECLGQDRGYVLLCKEESTPFSN